MTSNEAAGARDVEKDVVCTPHVSETAPDSTKRTQEQSDSQDNGETPPLTTYKVYKRRFIGLAQLVLLNIVVSWDVCEFYFMLHTLSFSDIGDMREMLIAMAIDDSGSRSPRYRRPPLSISRSPKVLSIG